MTGMTLVWGDNEPPKAERIIDGLDTLLDGLKTQPGTWARVAIEGVKPATLHTRLALAGCEVVRRKGGTEVHACWPATDTLTESPPLGT